jgi:hypothetical protein
VADHDNTKGDVMAGDEDHSHTRMLSPAHMIAWADGSVDAIRLRTYRDVIPGGFLAALAPARIDWKSSDLYGDDPFLIIRNVNYGGNPFDKTTMLHRVRVALNGIAFVEFTLVPSTRGGLHALAHHAQLRFVFKPEKLPVLLSLADSAAGAAACIPDLVLSWETWHESSVRYSGLKGFDSASYKLSMRAYAGPQRFLEDTLHGRDWFSYRVRMPGGEQGYSELLKVVLALGDGVANDTISGLLDKGEAAFLKNAPPDEINDRSDSEWQKVRELVLERRKIDDPHLNLSHDQGNYQTLVRSCATLARYAILTATGRLIDRGITDGVSPDTVPQPLIGEPTRWMEKIAHTNLIGMFIRAPLALAYIIRHPEAVPAKIPIELANAGLMEKRGGKAWVVQYSHKGIKPYDSLGICGMDYDS